MKWLFNTIYYAFVACIVLIALLLLATIMPIPGGLKAKIVKSGSMEPAIKTGSLVVIMPRDNYVVGDIITFGADTKTQIPTTHRIVSIDGDGPLRAIYTKGDANDAPDPSATRLSSIHGKVIFSIPYLGYVLDFAKKPLGFVLLVGVPAGIVILDEIMKIFRELGKIKRKKALNELNEDEQNNKS